VLEAHAHGDSASARSATKRPGARPIDVLLPWRRATRVSSWMAALRRGRHGPRRGRGVRHGSLRRAERAGIRATGALSAACDARSLGTSGRSAGVAVDRGAVRSPGSRRGRGTHRRACRAGGPRRVSLSNARPEAAGGNDHRRVPPKPRDRRRRFRLCDAEAPRRCVGVRRHRARRGNRSARHRAALRSLSCRSAGRFRFRRPCASGTPCGIISGGPAFLSLATWPRSRPRRRMFRRVSYGACPPGPSSPPGWPQKHDDPRAFITRPRAIRKPLKKQNLERETSGKAES
jgi:hypothetical protein